MNPKNFEVSPFFEPSFVERTGKAFTERLLNSINLRSCENCSLVMSKEQPDHSPEDCIVSHIMES